LRYVTKSKRTKRLEREHTNIPLRRGALKIAFFPRVKLDGPRKSEKEMRRRDNYRNDGRNGKKEKEKEGGKT